MGTTKHVCDRHKEALAHFTGRGRSEEDIASCLGDKKNLNGRNKLKLNHGNWIHCEQTETGDAGTLKKRGGNMRKQGMYGTQGRYQAIGSANRGGMGKTG